VLKNTNPMNPIYGNNDTMIAMTQYDKSLIRVIVGPQSTSEILKRRLKSVDSGKLE